MTFPDRSPRSRLAAAPLCFFPGWIGAHRFYVGKIGTGLLMVLTLGGFGLWSLIDLIFIICGGFTDDAGLRLVSWMPAEDAPSPRSEELQGRMDRIDRQLTDLQGVMIDMTDRLDRRRYGHLA